MNPKMSTMQQKRPWWMQGQALVEFSLILPVLLLIILGIIDYGRILLVYSNASSAVRDAARNATLLSADGSGTPLYVSCTTIDAQARSILFANITSLDVLYYDTTDVDDTALADATTNITSANPSLADFDCSAGGGVPLVTEDSVRTGDLMLVTMDLEIEFITPILANMFPTLTLDFRAQRTVIASISLELKGTDRDSDGLLDVWEYEWFGCLVDGWDEEDSDLRLMAVRPDNYYIIVEFSKHVDPPWNYLDATEANSDSISPATDETDPATWMAGSFTGHCATETLDPLDYPDGVYPEGCSLNTDGDALEGCFVPNVEEFNATDDPDHDGCNNGCEEQLDTNPLSDADDFSTDTDGDGLSDGQEANGWLYEYTVNGVPRSIVTTTLPLDEDTDDDGLLDGEEVNTYFSDPEDTDTDDDGLSDGDEVELYNTNPSEADSDSDGIDDRTEINGYVVDLEIDGSTIQVNVETDPNDKDTDNDGLEDGEERDGAVGYNLDPTNEDTDYDGIEDGDEITSTVGSTYETLANDSDTDDDLLLDGEEVNDFFVDPTEPNTDGLENCTAVDGTIYNLDDFYEAFSIYVDGNFDADGDGDYNGNDTESDEDTLPANIPPLDDCNEVAYYGTNPYNADTDGDTMDDGFELTIYCLDPNVVNPVIADESECTTGPSADADGDGLPDAWEEDNYLPADTYLTYNNVQDPDSDNCNNKCEYDRRTDPLDPDTDDDGLLDGEEIGTNPKDADTDDDGLNDGDEVNGVMLNTTINGVPFNSVVTSNPLIVDSDNDGLSDFEETIVFKTLATDNDTDNDGLSDGQEVDGIVMNTIINGVALSPLATSNPLLTDSDSDGLRDYNETMIYKTYANNVDTDGDTIPDGTTSTTIGERNNDENPVLYSGYGSNPRESDTDSDGLADNIEADGIDDYVIVIDGVAQPAIDLPGYDPDNSTSTTNLGMVNPDTDGDGLYDGDEIDAGTNPLYFDTDGDGLLDGADPFPLIPQGDVDSDGDGIFDDDEESAIPPTDPNDPDSDGDGMMDGDESLSVTIAATGYNLSTNATYAINFSNVSVNLDTTFQDGDGDGIEDGYDSDGDGLSDTFEMYWFRSTVQIQAIHPLHQAFSGSMESCGYALTGSQPLHPDDPDTDDDGLLDGDECNTYNTNPFSAANEGPIFDKIADTNFLNLVVYPALEGNLEEAAAGAYDLGLSVSSTDGMITVAIVRAPAPAPPPNRRQLMGTLITTACGDTAYQNNVGVVTIFTNRCGVYVGGSEPGSNNNDLTSPVLVRIPMSEFFSILSSSTVLSMTPQ